MRGSIIIDDRVEAEAIRGVQRDRGTPMVQLAHPRKGVWSGQNQLGVELPFQLDANFEQTIFKMDEWGFPEVWTLSLSVNVPTLSEGQAFDLVGEVSFGAGGIMQTFDVDWVDGTIFSLPMNSVNIRARWSDVARFFGIDPPENVRVSVIASRGSLRHSRATKTQVFNNPALGAGAYLSNPFNNQFEKIPQFAKSVVLTPSDLGLASVLYNANTFLEFFTNSAPPPAANICTIRIPGNFLGPTASFKVPIPANSRYWTIRNGSGAPIAVAGSLVWNLFDE